MELSAKPDTQVLGVRVDALQHQFVLQQTAVAVILIYIHRMASVET